jgi:[protein-PII] uridylyltransferase
MRSEATQPSSGRWQRLFDEFRATGDWAKLLAARTAAVDALVAGLAEELLFPAAPAAALVAVGGYGRRELFPHSDIDLLLLFESHAQAEAAREPVSAFVQQLWDAGLRISQSVRTPAECGEIHERNAELNVSLLDQRYLAGGAQLYGDMTERLNRLVRTRRHELARGLARLAAERHARWAETYCHLEPNVKETPGGLRDLQIVRWLARMRDAENPGELREAMALLARTRCWLHCRAGRDDNVLDFEAQEEIAERWGDGDAAAWMRRHYRAARAVHRAAKAALEASAGHSSVLFARFQDWRTRLSNADFSVSRERVHLRAPHALDSSPDLLLRLFRFVARHGVPLSLDAAERVSGRAAALAAHFAEPRTVWPILGEIFTLPHAGTALREMHETGALEAVFPELARIDCLVVRDFWHRFTIDEHSMAAIRNLLDLRGATDPARRGYAGLLEEIERPAALVFALLFHDVGKGEAGEGHVDGSLVAAESAMARIQMPPQDRRLVRFLIRHHLDMPEALRSRDLFDPATALYMAGLAGTVEDLKALTLISWADVSAVHPAAMTAWRAEQLWRLYLSTYNELTRELATDRIAAQSSAAPGFLEGFPTRYLRIHGDAEIEAHQRLDEIGRARGVAVEIERIDGAWRLTIVARDRPFLFASAAGALAAFGMNILKAEAYANRAGTVLDTFAFADPLRTLELNPTEVDRLRSTVARVVLGKLDVRQLLRNRPKPAPPSRKAAVWPAISFDNDASPAATLIQIVAQDRPGLLYDLASAISCEGCDIEVVLVDTEAHKAIDVFYVTAGGRQLNAPHQERLKHSLAAATTRL